MKIKFTFGDEGKKDFNNNQQDVNFFYASHTENGIAPTATSGRPEKITDGETIQKTLKHNKRGIVTILNFSDYSIDSLGKVSQYGQGVSNASLLNYESVSVYRREIWYDRFGNVAGAEKKWKQITPFITGSRLIDYTVLNNRNYEYVIRLSKYGKSGAAETLKGIYFSHKTNWLGWSITELHPTDDPNTFSASPVDVWRFKYNISTGAQTQNTSKTQQDTLSKFPKFSHGLKNAISGNVECLLGRDVLNADYTNTIWKYSADKLIWEMDPYGPTRNLGGYVESLDRRSDGCGKYPASYQSAESIGFTGLTSNQSLDMLDKWREVCYSGNPKLLKDEKGQGFIVQIFDTSNTTNITWDRMPETISFQWVQIADIKDVNVIQIIQ